MIIDEKFHINQYEKNRTDATLQPDYAGYVFKRNALNKKSDPFCESLFIHVLNILFFNHLAMRTSDIFLFVFEISFLENKYQHNTDRYC